MKSTYKSLFTIDKYPVTVFTSSNLLNCPIIYTHLSADTAKTAAEAILSDDKVNAVIAAIDGADWERDLSPWPAGKAFKGGNDFTGGADEYLKELTESIVPAVEEAIGLTPCWRAITGYSLYALYRTDIFSRAAAISGSLWYDGFIGFMKENRPLRIPEKVYLSLGDREMLTSNRRLAAVKECTSEAEELLKRQGVKTVFEMNTGNHFMDVSERIIKGLRWLL